MTRKEKPTTSLLARPLVGSCVSSLRTAWEAGSPSLAAVVSSPSDERTRGSTTIELDEAVAIQRGPGAAVRSTPRAEGRVVVRCCAAVYLTFVAASGTGGVDAMYAAQTPHG